MKSSQADTDDAWVRAYREASSQDDRRPDASVGDAVRAHARMLAQLQSDESSVAAEPDRVAALAANAGHWKMSMLGSLAVIGLVGLLVLQFDQGTTPQEKELAHGPVVATPPVAEPPAQANADKSATTAAVSANAVTRSTRPTQPKPQARQVPQTRPAQPAQPMPSAQALQLEQAPQAMQVPQPVKVPQALPNGAGTAAMPHTEAPIANEADASATAPAGIGRPRMAVRAQSGAVDADNELHQLAAEGRWRRFAQRLADGAPIDLRDARGRTPLMQAAAAGERAMVQHLLDDGANPALVDHAGKTARQLAIDAGHVDVAQLLPAHAQSGPIGR